MVIQHVARHLLNVRKVTGRRDPNPNPDILAPSTHPYP